MNKLMDKLKCNPLACFTVFFVIVILLFNSIKQDIIQMRQEISGIYIILVPKPLKTALLSPTTQNLAFKVPTPGLPTDN